MSESPNGKDKDMTSYSVYGLLVAGSRFTDDFSDEDAISMFMELHPEAVESEVRAELAREVLRHG